ncbi:MAG: hypothetical protein LBP53_05220 [Candidatus Peribacteria bacterium]|jgi:hypothetical protein|nr:hypothetical protein [Candidatus Peribacteria bacterium]
MGPTLSSEYGIEIDHENGTLLAFDPKKLAEFEKSIQKNGLGQVVIHPTTGRMQLITGKTTKEVITIKPHPELVKQNAQLDDNARILKAQELLNGEVLTEAQKQAILDAHNQEGTIYNLTPEQKRVRIDILGKAGFTSADIRVLFENGIVGKDYYKTKAEANPHFQETIDIEGIKKYFINKAQNTEGKEKEAYENSKFMCTINTKTTTKNFVQQHTKLKEKLLAEYKRINNLLPEGEKMPFERSELENFTQEQMKSLMDAHEADGKLGELTTGQLKEKVGLLAETVTNEQVRRFLLEGGFSGEN